jgi:hypothetical protein
LGANARMVELKLNEALTKLPSQSPAPEPSTSASFRKVLTAAKDAMKDMQVCHFQCIVEHFFLNINLNCILLFS